MTSVDGFLRSIDELMRSSMAVEIAKALAPDADNEPSAKPPGADSYAAPGRSSQSTALTPAGLRPPIAVLDHIDLEATQSVLKNILIVTPPTTSLLSAMAVAFKDAQTPLPSAAAAQQGFAQEDAAQLLATSSPADRLRGKELSPLQQVIASSRTQLGDVPIAMQMAPTEPERPEAGQQPDQLASDEVLLVRQHDAASKGHDSNVVSLTTLANGLLQTERTGIIDSFILNAAMIPGWPFQIQPATPELVAGAKISEEEALTYLANLGAHEALLEKLRKAKPPVGKKLLIYLATLLTALETVIDTVAAELAMLAGDEKALEERRASANSHGRAGARRRLYME
jgi:hypothetical protein